MTTCKVADTKLEVPSLRLCNNVLYWPATLLIFFFLRQNNTSTLFWWLIKTLTILYYKDAYWAGTTGNIKMEFPLNCSTKYSFEFALSDSVGKLWRSLTWQRHKGEAPNSRAFTGIHKYLTAPENVPVCFTVMDASDYHPILCHLKACVCVGCTSLHCNQHGTVRKCDGSV